MSVTAAAGVAATGVAAGIKPASALDLAVVVADRTATAAAVFTVNQAAAAPVILSRQHLAVGPEVRAVLLNSGCANAGTGVAGLADAVESAALVAGALECPLEEVLVCSTGSIGKTMPMENVLAGAAEAMTLVDKAAESGTAAATAIMTTDTIPKESTYAGDGFTVGGMAKGAGMVRPDMATMLVLLSTDAVAGSTELRDALTVAVDASFHSLNVDGCPSTNDTVILLASGASGIQPDSVALKEAVSMVCWDLANQLAADAEGASRVVTLEVRGAVDDATARSAGRLVADSALVRAAFYGGDPNWGRLLGAMGASSVAFDPADFGVAYEGIDIARRGIAVPHDGQALHAAIAEGDFTVSMTIGSGPGAARILTTDLTPEYVTFNAEYS